MSAHAPRLARLFTAEYARRINMQIVYPAPSVVIKSAELESALCRPLHVATYEPDHPAAYLAATLAYGIIKGHPFMDGNKRTAFYLANEYIRAMGKPGLADAGKVGQFDEEIASVAQRHIGVAAGKLGIQDLACSESNL